MSGLVRYEVADGIALLTLNRPEQRNAVNAELAADLRATLARFEADDTARVGILTGAGKVFSAGMDLKAFLAGEGEAILFGEGRFAGFVGANRTKPMIAAVNGAALAGGLEIALGCDLIVAEEGARFALPEVGVGIFAVAGGPFRLVRRIPPARAIELALTGQQIAADEALALGLINRIAQRDDVVRAAMDIAHEIARNAPLGVAATLQVCHAALQERDVALFALSDRLWASVKASEDAAEGPRAFAEKRAPKWAGK